MKKVISSLLSGSLLILFATCTDPVVKQGSSGKALPVDDADISFNGSYLVFSSGKIFDATVLSVTNASAGQIQQWNDHYGFLSMRTIYEQAWNEQDQYLHKLADTYLSYAANDPRLATPPQYELQPLTAQYRNMFVYNEKGLMNGLSEFNFNLASLLNSQGLVKVGNDIFQYNHDNIKIILGGDENKIAYLNETLITNKKAGIIVNAVNSITQPLQASGRSSYSASKACFNGDGSLLWKFQTNTSLSISTYQQPIYGQVCDCSASGAKQFCPCQDVIIDYTSKTTYTTHMDVNKNVLGICFGFRPSNSYITVDWTINHGGNIHSPIHLTDVMNTNLTIYDGPQINITSGIHTYSWNDTSGTLTNCQSTFQD